MSTDKALVILSGGQDSTTCLYWALSEGYDVHTITFDYGQRHTAELEAADVVATRAGVPPARRELVNVRGVLRSASPLMDGGKPLRVHDSTTLKTGVENTFVPMRNQLFLTVAANRAYELGAQTLVTGVCQADSGGYPDCTQGFIDAFEEVSSLGTFTGRGGLVVQTPLMNISKAGAVLLAFALPGCYSALAWTHTAYDGAYPPVGTDHATQLRAKGFAEARVPDPLVLRAYRQGLMDLPDTPNYSEGTVNVACQLLDSEGWLDT